MTGQPPEPQEWRVPFDDPAALQSLAEELRANDPDPPRVKQGFRIAEQVARIYNARIEIYAREHPPPHFHVNAADEDATFRLDDGNLLTGKLASRLHKAVQAWFPANQQKLIDTWNRTRPLNCPVGEFRLA